MLPFTRYSCFFLLLAKNAGQAYSYTRLSKQNTIPHTQLKMHMDDQPVGGKSEKLFARPLLLLYLLHRCLHLAGRNSCNLFSNRSRWFQSSKVNDALVDDQFVVFTYQSTKLSQFRCCPHPACSLGRCYRARPRRPAPLSVDSAGSSIKQAAFLNQHLANRVVELTYNTDQPTKLSNRW